MKSQNFEGLERKVQSLKKRCPWVSALLLHCLKTRNPQAFEAMRVILTRIRLSGV